MKILLYILYILGYYLKIFYNLWMPFGYYLNVTYLLPYFWCMNLMMYGYANFTIYFLHIRLLYFFSKNFGYYSYLTSLIHYFMHVYLVIFGHEICYVIVLT